MNTDTGQKYIKYFDHKVPPHQNVVSLYKWWKIKHKQITNIYICCFLISFRCGCFYYPTFNKCYINLKKIWEIGNYKSYFTNYGNYVMVHGMWRLNHKPCCYKNGLSLSKKIYRKKKRKRMQAKLNITTFFTTEINSNKMKSRAL